MPLCGACFNSDSTQLILLLFLCSFSSFFSSLFSFLRCSLSNRREPDRRLQRVLVSSASSVRFSIIDQRLPMQLSPWLMKVPH